MLPPLPLPLMLLGGEMGDILRGPLCGLRLIAQSGRAGSGCCDPGFTVVALREEDEADD